MKEYISAAERFAEDLNAVGVSRPHRTEVAAFYLTALVEKTDEAWTAFYRHVAESLQHCSCVPLDAKASVRLCAFLDDDFGRTVLDAALRARLRYLLLRYRAA